MIKSFEAFNGSYQSHLFPDKNGPKTVGQQFVNHFIVNKKNHLEGLVKSGSDAVKFFDGTLTSQCMDFVKTYVENESNSYILSKVYKYLLDNNKDFSILNNVNIVKSSSLDYLQKVCDAADICPFKVVVNYLTYKNQNDYRTIQDFFNENKHKPDIKLYRCVALEKDPYWIAHTASKYSGVGIYWTYNPVSAQPYLSKDASNDSIILEANVAWSDIAWNKTMHRSLYDMSYEHEVVLEKLATPEVQRICLNNTFTDITPTLVSL